MEIQATSQIFWEDQWLKIIERSKAEQPTRPGTCAMNKWDNMAKDFAQRTSGEKAAAKRDATLKQLVDKGILTPETRVLDIIYPFNFVYAMGYRPDITFSWWDKEIDWDRDHTIRHITRFFQPHMEITQEAKQIIADYVETRCIDGKYAPAAPVCRGAMTWSVHEDRRTTPGELNDI
jgi:hypothetical protein